MITEATWNDEAETPTIDWRMSASLENVLRGDEDLAEVTSLEGAVRAWRELDEAHRGAAVLRPERSLQINGAVSDSFVGSAISALVERLLVPSSD